MNNQKIIDWANKLYNEQQQKSYTNMDSQNNLPSYKKLYITYQNQGNKVLC